MIAFGPAFGPMAFGPQSSLLRTVERGTLGPVLRSSTVSRLRHFKTVFGLIPNVSLSSLAEADDRCIAALTACVRTDGGHHASPWRCRGELGP